jgi:hypothetical protein
MAKAKRTGPTVRQLQGFKYLKRIDKLLKKLHRAGCERDRAGNRELHFNQYALLILLYFFSPALSSLRDIQRASRLKKLQRVLGIESTSLGSLSEAADVFDAALLEPVIQELVGQVAPGVMPSEQEALRALTAVDGSLLPALPQMAWALWQDERHRAAKLHLSFEVWRAVPVQARITPGSSSETAALRDMLEPGRIYVLDRGYAEYALFQTVLDRQSSLIARVCSNTTWTEVLEERALSPQALEAGVRADRLVWLGGPQSGQVFKQPLRLLEIETEPTTPGDAPGTMLLVTDLQDLPAELVALAYRYRWTVELFFRWLKCILGCRHLLSTTENGVTVQVYLAIIASLLISLWTGTKPCKATFTMINFYLMGWADDEELTEYLDSLKRDPPPPRAPPASPQALIERR